jgi:hypothetical protein
MWNLVTWTAERMPQTIKEVETKYWVVDVLKFAEEAMMIGGVTREHLIFNLEILGQVDLLMPANIANAC